MKPNYRKRSLECHDNKILELIQSNMIISITDVYGRIIYANDKFCEILELNRSEIIGEAHELFESRLHSETIYKDLWETIIKGNTWKGVLPNHSSSDKLYWLDTTIIPVLDHDKNIVEYVAMYVDVTEAYNEKNEIIKKESVLRVFTESIPNIVLSIDSSGKILEINKDIGRFTKSEVIGKMIFNYINNDYHTLVKKHISKVFVKGKLSRYETVDYGLDNTKTFYVSDISPVFNDEGDVISATISMQNITSLKKINKELDDIGTKYHNIFQAINVGMIVVVDHKGNIIEWNKESELAFGYTKSEIIGKHLTNLISEQYRKSSVRSLLQEIKKLKHRQEGELIEMFGQRKNGQIFPVEFSLKKIKKGENASYCAMMRDITKRKQLDSKLKQKTKELELFLYRSAHDLKAPFTSAEGLLNLIKEERDNAKVEELTEMLQTTIERGKKLLDNLALASVISGKKRKLENIDFALIINDAFITMVGAKNFELIKFKKSIMLPHKFYSNTELINSIFLNLIQNAIKYSSPFDDSKSPFVKIIIRSFDNGVKIIISDNGVGIGQNDIDKIFDLYYRVNNDDIPGTGLGLYIVKNIVEDINGEIKVKSELNVGTSFEITLPNILNKVNYEDEQKYYAN